MASEPVKPYFTRFLRVLTFCLGASKIVVFCENGVVNGVVKLLKYEEFGRINGSITNFVGFPIPLVALSAHIE